MDSGSRCNLFTIGLIYGLLHRLLSNYITMFQSGYTIHINPSIRKSQTKTVEWLVLFNKLISLTIRDQNSIQLTKFSHNAHTFLLVLLSKFLRIDINLCIKFSVEMQESVSKFATTIFWHCPIDDCTVTLSQLPIFLQCYPLFCSYLIYSSQAVIHFRNHFPLASPSFDWTFSCQMLISRHTLTWFFFPSSCRYDRDCDASPPDRSIDAYKSTFCHLSTV